MLGNGSIIIRGMKKNGVENIKKIALKKWQLILTNGTN